MAETKELSTQSRVKTLLETDEINNRFKSVLGENSGLFKASIISAIAMNETLQKAEPMSIISSAMIAATLKLPITPSLGLAYIVPYKGYGTFQIGWKGLVQLALRSGQFKTMNATVVYEGQLIHNNQFTGEATFQDARSSEKIAGYLFYFKLVNGFEKYTYWTKEQCESHAKQYSATYRLGKGKWVDAFDDMALKTVVKMGLSKWGVLSVEMQNGIASDESVDGKYPDAVETQAERSAPQPTSARLRDIVTTTAETTPVAAPASPASDLPI